MAKTPKKAANFFQKSVSGTPLKIGDLAAFMQMAQNGDLAGVKAFIRTHGAVDEIDAALYHAAGSITAGAPAVVSYLIDIGADVNYAVSPDHTALIAAVSNNRRDIVTLLLDKGAHLSCTDPTMTGFTPLITAIRCHHGDIAALLIEKSDIDHKDKYLKTARDWAIELGQFDIAYMIDDEKEHRIIQAEADQKKRQDKALDVFEKGIEKSVRKPRPPVFKKRGR